MVSRVLLNTSGLKVSKPGVDVLATGKGGLLFSSDWSQLSLFATGAKSINWTIITSGADAGQEAAWSDSISFGKTFETVPLVAFTLDFGTSKRLPVGDTSGFTYGITQGVDRYFWVAAHVRTNGIDFWARYNKKTADWAQPNGTIRYSIMNYNL